MGTNYYVRTPPCPNACDHCDAPQRIHLGKTSVGWRFSFHANPEWPREHAFTQWVKLALTGAIEDEHGTPATLAELLHLIHNHRGDRSHLMHQPGLGYRADTESWFEVGGHEFCTRDFS